MRGSDAECVSRVSFGPLMRVILALQLSRDMDVRRDIVTERDAVEA